MNRIHNGTVVHYFSVAKNKQHGFALLDGFGARAIPVEYGRLETKTRVDLHIVGGLQFGALQILKQVRRSGAQYLFVDRAYFAGGPKTNRLRVCRNQYQKNEIEPLSPRDLDHYLLRARALGIELEPWRKSGDHILLVPPSAEICELFGLGDWKAKTLERLKRSSDRPIDVSVKGDPRPLAERFERCHCVVTWSSNVAVEAIVAGVPAIVGPESAARPLAGKLEELERVVAYPPTPYPDELREAWVASLQRGQFELGEIANGTARRILLEGAAR